MADYNSDRTGSNIDLTLDKVDALVDSGNNVTADRLTVDKNYVFQGANYHFKLGENSGDSYLGSFGNGHFSATGYYYGSNQYQLTGGSTNLTGYAATSDFTIFAEDGLTADSLATSKARLRIDGATGDVSFFEDTGTTAKMVWDASAESLGIGTASPSQELHVVGSGAGQVSAMFESSGASTSLIGFNNTSATNSSQVAFGSTGNHAIVNAGGTERARIDSSGNLLVGKTALDVSVVGHQFLSDASGDYAAHTSNETRALLLNRKGTDGEIASFRKDGATVGSIGANGGNTFFAGVSKGIRFRSGDVLPTTNTGDGSDASVDLGISTVRWKDLYLSGGVITSSDYRLKEDVQPMQSYADTIKQMNLVNFAWKDSGEREDGFIAHELQSLVPSAVRGDKDAIDEDGNEQYQGVDPLKLIPVLTKALQEALERIETLEAK